MCTSALHRRVGFAALLATLAVVTAEATAHAAASARLFYGRSPTVQGCADEAALRDAIARRVGYDPIFPMAPNSVSVSITRDGAQLVAEVKLTNREGLFVGSRTLKGPASDCAELTDTIALTVAIALDENDMLTPSASADPTPAPLPSPSASPPQAPSPAPSPTPAQATAVQEAQTAADDSPDDTPPAAASPTPSSHLELGAGIGGTLYGISPSASVGAMVNAALRWSRLSIGIEGLADLPASAAAAQIPGARVRTSLVGAGPVACLHFGDYFGCAVGIVASLHAEAFGVPGASTASAVDVLAGIRGGLALPLASWLRLRVSVDLLADPVPPTVEASGQSLWRASVFAAASQLGLTVRIP